MVWLLLTVGKGRGARLVARLVVMPRSPAAAVPEAPARGATVAPGLVREGPGLAAREPMAGVARKLGAAAKGMQPRALVAS